MAAIANLEVDQGSDFSAQVLLENDDGSRLNLTNFTSYSQFRKSYGSTIAYNLTSAITNAQQGIITLSLSGVNSSNIKPGRYIYDVEIISELGVKTRVVEGIITINPEITKIP